MVLVFLKHGHVNMQRADLAGGWMNSEFPTVSAYTSTNRVNLTIVSSFSNSNMSAIHKNNEKITKDDEETEQRDEDEDYVNEIALSPEAAAALRAFALSSGVAIDTSDENEGSNDLLSAVRDHFDLKERDETFVVEYQDNDDDTDITQTLTKRHIRFEVQGVKRVLGQTLSSTGLTIWRAAEHLCDYMFHHPARFQQRTVCELVSVSVFLTTLSDPFSVLILTQS